MNHVLTFYDDETSNLRVHDWRARAIKASQYLGPWCPDCGKKGTKCKKRDACRLRGIVQNPGPKFLTLPRAPGAQKPGLAAQAMAYRECVKRGDIQEAVAA